MANFVDEHHHLSKLDLVKSILKATGHLVHGEVKRRLVEPEPLLAPDPAERQLV